MAISEIALWVATATYGAASIAFLFEGKLAWATVYGGYVLANIGIIIAARG